MSWQTIDLSTLNPNLEVLPEKPFDFELLPGAKYSDRDPDTVEAVAAVVSEGEFKGRKLFFKYTPENAKALKRLALAMGVDVEPNEDPVAYLNRAAGNRFNTSVRHAAKTPEYPNPKAFLQIWSVAPAA